MPEQRAQGLMGIYRRMLATHGPQGWWPADTPFEIMVGAILTQNTRWNNVEKAIERLKRANLLNAERIATCNAEQLAEHIRPAGFFRQKSRYLQTLGRFCFEAGGIPRLRRMPASILRRRLLALTGIGPETADSILLYALDKPVFVVDAYTRRIFHRLGLLPEHIGYEETQRYFHDRLPHSLPLFREYHALIVAHAKHHCRARPVCATCPLQPPCPHASGAYCGNHTHAQASGHVDQSAD